MADFPTLVGQHQLREQFERFLKAGDFPHALLLLGPTGSGKHSWARALARAVFCERETWACGQCPACRYLAADTHPDYREPLPEGTKNLKVEELRAALEGLRLKPQLASRQVFLLDLDLLQEQGQNVLLKSLEEPPGEILFLLCASQGDAVLPTVRSRCRIFRMGRLSDAELRQVFKQKGMSLETAEAVLPFAAGLPGQALKLAEDQTFADLRRELAELLGRLGELSETELLGSVLNRLLELKTEHDSCLQILEVYYRALARWPQPTFAAEDQKILAKLAEGRSVQERQAIAADAISRLAECREARSVNVMNEVLWGQVLLGLAAGLQRQTALSVLRQMPSVLSQ